MTYRPWFTICLVLALTAGSSGQTAREKYYINRRDQARQAFLATPQGIYGHYCANCHGADGKGDGLFWDLQLTPAPADLTAVEADKGYLLDVIRDGSTAHGKSNLCPPWGRTISPENINRLAQYILTLGGAYEAHASAEPIVPVDADPGEPQFPWTTAGVVLAELLLLAGLLLRYWLVLLRRVPWKPVEPTDIPPSDSPDAESWP